MVFWFLHKLSGFGAGMSQVRFPVSRAGRLYLPTNVEFVWKTADFYDMAAIKAFSHTNAHPIDLCFDLLRSVYDVAIHVIPHIAIFVDWAQRIFSKMW